VFHPEGCVQTFTFVKKTMNRSDDEFLKYWAANRAREKKWLNQLSLGLPLGLVFGLPIVLSVLLRGWYKRMPFVSGTQFTIILMACLGIAVFYAIFRMKFKWDMNEQHYRELLQQREKEKNAVDTEN
jgi:protein-S-isoprenylcysteine O-methyltransferase Ste14